MNSLSRILHEFSLFSKFVTPIFKERFWTVASEFHFDCDIEIII